MTKFEHEILTYICVAGNPMWTAVLEAFRSSMSIDDTEAVLKALLNARLIEIPDKISRPPLCKLQISDSGRVSLLSYNERRKNLNQKMAEQQANEKRNRKFQLLNTVLGSLLSFIFGLVIEHFISIVDLVTKYFSVIENAISRIFS